MSTEKNSYDWYNNPTIITNFIIGLIIIIMLLSQSFAINNNLSSMNIIRDIINHNINYIFVLIYFVLLKTIYGKRYFNFLNLFLTCFYLVITVTSLLSVFQVVSITSIISVLVKIVTSIYLIHTMFRDTRYWKEFKLDKSLFNEFDNNNYFYFLTILSTFLLAIKLIFVSTFDGAILTILDSLYIILLARYIYLYREYLDNRVIVKEEK